MMTTLFAMVGAAFLLIMGVMLLLWIYYCFNKNAGIVDLGWTASFILAAWAYFILGDGYLPRRLVIALMVTVWAGRLLWYLTSRFQSDIEDPRYTALLQAWGKKHIDLKVLSMFILQGLIALTLSFTFLIISQNTRETWSFWEGWGFLVWILGTWGETVADAQKHKFRSDPANLGRVCNVGLWRFSRHPNYFFEWILWIGFFLFALGSPLGWITVYAPAIMLYMLLYVSGVPLAEAHALKFKGDAYRQYQQTTSTFVPWPPSKQP